MTVKYVVVEQNGTYEVFHNVYEDLIEAAVEADRLACCAPIGTDYYVEEVESLNNYNGFWGVFKTVTECIEFCECCGPELVIVAQELVSAHSSKMTALQYRNDFEKTESTNYEVRFIKFDEEVDYDA